MANAIVILIAIVDAPKYGYGFSGVVATIVIYNVTNAWNLDVILVVNRMRTC